MTASCPRCTQPLLGGYRFCRSCGLDVGGPTAPSTDAPGPSTNGPFTPAGSGVVIATAPPTNQLAVVGGVAWVISAALTGYLALLQFGFVGSVLDTGSLEGAAIWNGVASALTLYFGIRCLMNPTRGFLTTMVAWGVLDVAWGVYQIGGGVTHWAYLGSVVAAGVAGLVCLVARGQAPIAPGKMRRSPA